MAARSPKANSHDPADVADLVRRVGAVLDELRLTEAEVSWGDLRVRVQRAAAPLASPAGALAGGMPEPVVIVERPGAMATIESPMVGTFYRASGPTAAPYVVEGDMVKEGQIVCIIEAMKLMNEIEAKVAGRVAKVLVENGQPVEYGQALFLIEPSR
jgi:acetyl-CoA carboxylase biotin carboxyl carrier protein